MRIPRLISSHFAKKIHAAGWWNRETQEVEMNREQRRPRIWAIAGGKGGVGKSVVASALATALARSGFRCIAVDADFGAANLHSLLGVARPQRTLRSFFNGGVQSLKEVTIDTRVPGLRLISGSEASINAANLSMPGRQKLIRHLRQLPADEVVIDLAAGTSLNVLDFFVAADMPVAVTIPQPTAIDNTYHLIKASWFRSMSSATRRKNVREALKLVLGNRRAQRGIPPKLLIGAVAEIDASAASVLAACVKAFRPCLAVNRVRSGMDRAVCGQIVLSCEEALGVHPRAVGSLQDDRFVSKAVDSCQPVLEMFPDSDFARDVYEVTERLLVPSLEKDVLLRSTGPGRMRRALGLDRGHRDRRRQISSLADLAACG
jgi:flagellar biosynthesis protein FlhG